MNSADYWQEREELHIKEMMEKDVQDSKDISRMYARAYRDIQRDINDFYVRYTNENDMSLTEARRAVSKFDVEAFRDKAAQYVRDKDFSDQANEELRLYNLTMRVNRLELLKSEIGLECAALGNDIDKMFMQTLTEEAKAEALRQSGILGETLETLDVKQIDKIVRGSWQVKMQTQPTFSEAIWGHNEALKSRIDTMLTQSIIAGKHPREMASELMKIFDSSRYEAERLLRTESARVQGDIQMANFEQYGFEWYNIVREPTACKICIEAAANGPYKVRDKMIGLTMYPFHPNCRCSATPAKRNDNEEVKNNDAPQMADFKPAATIEEAEAFANKYTNADMFAATGVSYKGVHLDVANSVNKAIADIYHNFDIGPIGGVIAPAKNTKLGKLINAHAAYSPIRQSVLLNRVNTKKLKDFENGLLEDREAYTSILSHPERYDFSKMGLRLRTVIENAKETGRGVVPENAVETIYHELGHHIERSITKEEYADIKKSFSTYGPQISGYAAYDASEYVAESIASYMKGETLSDPVMIGIIKRLHR